MTLLLSVLAAAAYVVGGVFMRKADGFSHALPAAMVFACFGVGAALQTLAMRRSELGINYVLVLGLEAALAVLLGAAWLGETPSPRSLAGLALILAGVMVLRLQEERRPDRPGSAPSAARGGGVTLRTAEPSDVASLLRLVNGYAERGLLLPRSEDSLRASLAGFVVAVRRAGDGEQIVGCGALARLGPGLGEVRSLAVRADAAGQGTGRRIVGTLLLAAREQGLVRVLALTLRPELFQAAGFVPTRRERFPEKLRVDCGICPRRPRCEEVAMVAAIPLVTVSTLHARGSHVDWRM